MIESAITFRCGSDDLIGVLHRPSIEAQGIGILIVVGGPQYRVGSHRQFVLMARAFAAAGYPVLRFDYRGMGDSSGESRSFEAVDDDICSAIDTFFEGIPALTGVVVFGLCDAASAALIYCLEDKRLLGLILANPWVRTEAGEARALVKHYYGRRLLQRSFWRKVLSGELGARQSAQDLLRSWFLARRNPATGDPRRSRHFLDRMQEGLMGFAGPVMLLVSERDLTAGEFQDLCRSEPAWSVAVSRENVRVAVQLGADHTFSSSVALNTATSTAIEWLAGLSGGFCDSDLARP